MNLLSVEHQFMQHRSPGEATASLGELRRGARRRRTVAVADRGAARAGAADGCGAGRGAGSKSKARRSQAPDEGVRVPRTLHGAETRRAQAPRCACRGAEGGACSARRRRAVRGAGPGPARGARCPRCAAR
jgi:hypothetical protein